MQLRGIFWYRPCQLVVCMCLCTSATLIVWFLVRLEVTCWLLTWSLHSFCDYFSLFRPCQWEMLLRRDGVVWFIYIQDIGSWFFIGVFFCILYKNFEAQWVRSASIRRSLRSNSIITHMLEEQTSEFGNLLPRNPFECTNIHAAHHEFHTPDLLSHGFVTDGTYKNNYVQASVWNSSRTYTRNRHSNTVQ